MSLQATFLIWVVGGGAFSWYFKKPIARAAVGWGLPRVVTYLLLSLPFVLVEEYLTCERPYFQCIPVTVPAFALMFLILYGIYAATHWSFMRLVVVFGLIGWINEFILVGRIQVLSGPMLLLFSVLAILIYMVVAIVPAYYLAGRPKP